MNRETCNNGLVIKYKVNNYFLKIIFRSAKVSEKVRTIPQ